MFEFVECWVILPSRPPPFSMTRILESPGSTNWRVIYAIQDLDISKA